MDSHAKKKITPELLKKMREEISLELGENYTEILRKKGITEKDYAIQTGGACPLCGGHHSKRD